jgi:hypothetical protein
MPNDKQNFKLVSASQLNQFIQKALKQPTYWIAS